MKLSEKMAAILTAVENGCNILNLFARNAHACENRTAWEQRYNKELHKINGMQEMAGCFGYEVTFDFNASQGFYAEVTHINIVCVDDDGECLTAYRHNMRRERK